MGLIMPYAQGPLFWWWQAPAHEHIVLRISRQDALSFASICPFEYEKVKKALNADTDTTHVISLKMCRGTGLGNKQHLLVRGWCFFNAFPILPQIAGQIRP